MILHDLHILGTTAIKHIHVEQGKIKAITNYREDLGHLSGEQHLELDKAMAFPGLINSHDHLDFNLFPRLGNRIYDNYTEWGADIHLVNSEIIKQVLRIPLPLRIKWGLYKNLLNGFTTVVNHGDLLRIEDELITVVQDGYTLHSPAFEKNWKWKLNKPFKKHDLFVMHIGEGTDPAAEKEISEVIRWNLFKRKIIAVHGVAMKESQAASFAGLVWCPASNYFLLKRTAAIDKLKSKTKIVFGSDSTLTAPWNLWEHIRQAKKTGMMTDEELIEALTTIPAELWGRKEVGTIEANKTADMVVTRKNDDFFNLNPEDILLVIHQGNIRMFDSSLSMQLNNLVGKDFESIALNVSVKYVQGDLSALIDEIKSYGIQTNL